MSEKLCLKWNDFQENVNTAFGNLREDSEFADVTLACEDGQQMEAHKVILAASSPFFDEIFQRIKHPYPLIYLRGFKSEDFVAILDFLYFGEAKVYQENFDSFLAIAEELKLKGLTGQAAGTDLAQEEEKPFISTPVKNIKEKLTNGDNVSNSPAHNASSVERVSGTHAAIPKQICGDLKALEEKVKSLMERSQNMVPAGTQACGIPKQDKAFICKVCGKEGHSTNIRHHIEANHLEGISIPCNFCDKDFGSRASLSMHKSRVHK